MRIQTTRLALGGLISIVLLLPACRRNDAPDESIAAPSPPALEPVAGPPGVAMETRTLLDGLLTLDIPAGFELMDEQTTAAKYAAETRPAIVYTNAETTVNVTIDHAADPARLDDLAATHRTLDEQFRRRYPAAAWFRSGLVTIDDRPFVILDLRTPALDTEIRNLFVATAADGRLLTVSFNMTAGQEAKWLPVGEHVIRSVAVAP